MARSKATKSAAVTPAPHVTPQVILDLIRQWKWFAYIPKEAHEWLAERMAIRDFAAGTPLYFHGDPAPNVYAVISGIFRIYMSYPSGDEITLEEVVRGGWFSYVLKKEPQTHLANCICQQSGKAAMVPQSVLNELGRRWPGYYEGIYEELIDRCIVTVGRIELLSLHNLNTRLTVFLLRMAKLRGRQEAGGTIWIAADENQAEIGTRVGGTRQSVNAVLQKWSKKGMIEFHKDGTRILDIKRLVLEGKKSGFNLQQYLDGWHGGWEGKP